MNMIFEDVKGGPVARRERDQAGEARVVDNARYFGLAMAAEHFGWTEQALREMYCETFAEAAIEQHEAAQPESKDVKDIFTSPLVGPLTAAADPTLRHFVYGYLEDGEFECFLRLCEARGASPWARDIIPEVETNGMTRLVHYITTISFLRTVAQRESDYAGQVGPFWCGEDAQWKDVWTAKDLPTACRVGVLKTGAAEPMWGTLRWDELGLGGEALPDYYERMPTYMIGVRAEAAALRRAYPAAARLYLREEMPRSRPPAPARPAAPTPQPREIDLDDGRRIVYDEPEPLWEDSPRPPQRASDARGRRQPAYRN